MKTFRVMVERKITERVWIDVRARNEETAHEFILQMNDNKMIDWRASPYRVPMPGLTLKTITEEDDE